MQFYVNLWGGEGFLTAASLLAMTSIGMFDGLTDASGQPIELHYRCLDFATKSPDDQRQKTLYDSYSGYFEMIFGHPANSVFCDPITISGVTHFSIPPTLEGKFGSKENLAIGCEETDMILDITSGIYGKPWVGETYHSDSNFHNLYTSASGNILVANCGGYKGGGTAATFIYLENGFNIKQANPNVNGVERFTVIAGPSTEFYHMTQIPNNVYDGMGVNLEIDLFDIPNVIQKLENLVISGANASVHQANIDFLKKEYERIKSPEHDYRNLDPKYYMARFIDRIRSDTSLGHVNANFINIKPNPVFENGTYHYDQTSTEFQPDSQSHQLHITNLQNAVTLQEIALNHGKYNGGDFYTFCSPFTEKYTIDSVFLPDDAKKFYRFLIFSVIVTKYLYSYFDDIKKPGADDMLVKWAKEINSGGWKRALNPNTPEGSMNITFATTVKNMMADLACQYIRPVLDVFMDIENTSPDVEFFSRQTIAGTVLSDGLYGVVNGLINNIVPGVSNSVVPIEDPKAIKSETENILAAVLMGKEGYPNNFAQTLAMIQGTVGSRTDFLSKYLTEFPTFGNFTGILFAKHWVWDGAVNEANLQEKAQEYCKQIISYTYGKIQKELI
ncbi:MAG: hypothetical protein IJ642_10365 [Oscillospiraceae bacterium]|nr:hypothetical protein [Oscillospiraceae bacterium]